MSEMGSNDQLSQTLVTMNNISALSNDNSDVLQTESYFKASQWLPVMSKVSVVANEPKEDYHASP